MFGDSKAVGDVEDDVFSLPPREFTEFTACAECCATEGDCERRGTSSCCDVQRGEAGIERETRIGGILGLFSDAGSAGLEREPSDESDL